MAIEAARAYLAKFKRDQDIMELELSSATVELAALAVGVEGARIAKTLCLRTPRGAMLIVAAGDARIDNRKYKDHFGFKAAMCTPEETLEHTGHAVGGVCPFGLKEPLEVYLDRSLCRFEEVFPACGSANSAIRLTIPDLQRLSCAKGFVDVCKLPQ